MEELAKKYAALKREIETSPLFSGDGQKRVWKHSDPDAVTLVEQYREAHSMLATEGISVPYVLGEAIVAHESLDGIVSLMPITSTWAQGYHALRDACAADINAGRKVHHPTYVLDGKVIHRPFTFGENLRARIVDARAHNNDITQASSWNRYNDSCTAIIYGTDGKFKVQTISRDLLLLPPEFSRHSVQVRYDDITNGADVAEFECRGVKYNELLTQEEVLCHPFWQFVADGNIDVLRDYTQLQWAGKKADYKGMGVWISDSPQNVELRALFVNYRNYNSNANGRNNLNNNGSFLRVLASYERRKPLRAWRVKR